MKNLSGRLNRLESKLEEINALGGDPVEEFCRTFKDLGPEELKAYEPFLPDELKECCRERLEMFAAL